MRTVAIVFRDVGNKQNGYKVINIVTNAADQNITSPHILTL